LAGINIPTLKEQGIDVVLGNWRGVFGAAGISAAERQALTDRVVKATKSAAWAESLTKNNWTPALLTGKAFDDFVDRDFSALRATMVRAGMV
jgi:putative tricarboxylic transport membrane protein